MTNNNITLVELHKEPDTIFASGCTTDFIRLDNYKCVEFVIISGKGELGDITVSAVAQNSEEPTAVAIPFVKKLNATDVDAIAAGGTTLTIGGDVGGCVVYRVTADDLAQSGSNEVALKIGSKEGSDVVGTVVAILSRPRHTDTV